MKVCMRCTNLPMRGKSIAISWTGYLPALGRAAKKEFRKQLISRLRLKSGDTVLVTAVDWAKTCFPIAHAIGQSGRLYAQDLSKTMVLHASANFAKQCDILIPNFSVGDALSLPFPTGTFDAVFISAASTSLAT